ncbi:sodium-dependent phosphate transporter 1-like [Tubulanus polymorphus]|uniref:sodium-dependent phosphate transporter 1-like n=1 Tax=Tubulanus polymorphus TaxID=672921 RepID=UPI003DA44E01
MATIAQTTASTISAAVTTAIDSIATTVASGDAPLIPPEFIWMVVVGFIVAFCLAFGIGANDVANSFGTAVGAKVLTLYQACALASVFELAGAILLGSKVSDTIRKGIIDIEPYNGTEEVLMVGNVAALTGSCCWLLVATFLRVPVSGTHSIVGATVGFALVAHGAKGIHWAKVGLIVASWFISPLMSGAISCGIFFLIRKYILQKADQLEPGLFFLPIIYAVTIVINVFSVFYEGPPLLGFDKIPLWGTFVISFGVGIIVCLVIKFAVVPWQRRKIKHECLYIRANQSEDPLCELTLSETLANNSVANSRDQSEQNSKSSSTASSKEDLTLKKNNELNNELNTALKDEKKDLQNGNAEKPIDYKIDMTPTREDKDNGLLFKSTASGKPLLGDMFKKKKKKGKKEKEEKVQESTDTSLNESDDAEALRQKSRDQISDSLEARRLFSFLQVLTAIFGGFAHGGNDVSNAIGPLIGLWVVAVDGSIVSKTQTPIWILFYGGVGISVGLWIWGRRVIKTMGEDLTKITPSSGFCIEIGSALTVLVASNIGIPVSTTHCKVGSVVTVGRLRSSGNVDWKLFRNIIFAWVVTLPVSGGISAGVFAGLRMLV